MVKVDLINRIHKQTRLTKEEIGVVLDSFFNIVVDVLNTEETITLANFGVFKPKIIPEHQGVLPSNYRHVLVKRKVVPTFKFAKAMRNKFRSEKAEDRFVYLDEPVINENLDETK